MVKWSYLCQVFLGFLFLWDISNRHWSVSLEEPGAWLTKIKSSVEKWWKQPFNHCPFSYSLGGAYFTNICWRSSWYRFQMIFILWILCSRSKVRIVMEMPILYMTISNLPDPVVAKTEYEVLCQVRSLFWLLRLGWHSLRYLDMPHNIIDLTHFFGRLLGLPHLQSSTGPSMGSLSTPRPQTGCPTRATWPLQPSGSSLGFRTRERPSPVTQNTKSSHRTILLQMCLGTVTTTTT